jgi:hypothetical protein
VVNETPTRSCKAGTDFFSLYSSSWVGCSSVAQMRRPKFSPPRCGLGAVMGDSAVVSITIFHVIKISRQAKEVDA